MARILVVDDEPSVLAVVSRALREDHHDVIAVSNGQTACEIVMAERIDVVVTNHRMPGLSTPIVPLRHHSQALHGLFQLPDDVPTLFKPFDLAALKLAVRRRLGPARPTQPELSFL